MTTERIPYFINKLAEKPENYQEICRQEVAYLKSSYTRHNRLSLATLKRAYSRYRNLVRESFDGEFVKEAIGYFTLTEQENIEYITKAKASVDKDVESIEQKQIDAEGLVARAEELLEEKGYLRVCLGLALLTGRRPTELLYSGRFFPSTERSEAIEYAQEYLAGQENKNLADETFLEERVRKIGECEFLYFVGQLKQADSIWRARQPLPIPILTDADRILNGLEKLRELKDFSKLELTSNEAERGLTIEDKVHNLTNSALNRKTTGCKHPKVFGDLLPADKCNCKGLRSAYATICHAWYGTGGFTLYFARILGHSERSNSTSEAYYDFTL